VELACRSIRVRIVAVVPFFIYDPSHSGKFSLLEMGNIITRQGMGGKERVVNVIFARLFSWMDGSFTMMADRFV
jgi:hypothetical protein